jgi:hypothetical protein
MIIMLRQVHPRKQPFSSGGQVLELMRKRYCYGQLPPLEVLFTKSVNGISSLILRIMRPGFLPQQMKDASH